MNSGKRNRPRRSCSTDPNEFCYICAGYLLPHKKKLPIFDPYISKLYEMRFGFAVAHKDKIWAPKWCCSKCQFLLKRYAKGRGSGPEFVMPALWQEPRSHYSDCYFCNFTSLLDGRFPTLAVLKSITFQSTQSCKLPVPSSENQPLPLPLSKGEIVDVFETDSESEDEDQLQEDEVDNIAKRLHLCDNIREMFERGLKKYNIVDQYYRPAIIRREEELLKQCLKIDETESTQTAKRARRNSPE